MKQIILSTLAVAGMFAFISCERHSWEDSDGEKGTKNLYPTKTEHGDHGDHADADAGDDSHEGHNH
ncbi:hypothetical protein JIN77_15020 [Verrucomicrobiaceae bacterium R5-34]|uniref:Uncharacterized protein n=1 Tax=Oceaniferula flava TaxID=2800421 RepID=A0AAE2VB48_9BACT|nr:hypothetical protein [Oceaniferula flavus]MBK1832046.1 hypothetical protein [Verrucomicrobiaceae bacterium R5-34]MBK1854130.1 hypothetical protein [Oceaniferula flavus]MBM1135436.1 hypothetical protein [Oceaniferula flavus]